MQIRRAMQVAAVCLFAATQVLSAGIARAAGPGPENTALSPYWGPKISRWEPYIAPNATALRLDPDFVAAIIEQETHGVPGLVGPGGSVGLMQIMPYEAGFTWRPTTAELHNAWTNIAWGSNTIAEIIQQADGDVLYALAAYNGSWEKVHKPGPRRYAAAVLDYYTCAVAAAAELGPDGDWMAIIGVYGPGAPSTITVLGPQRELTRYTDRPTAQASIPVLPSPPPHRILATFVNDQGLENYVGVWLLRADGALLPVGR